MVTIGMNYQVLAGKETIFENAVKGVVEAMRKDSEHVKTNLYRDVDDQGTFLIVSEWSSEEAFKAFIGSELFAKVTSWGKEQILRARPSHTVYGSGA